ncbi:hypothetical protein BT96DRAFT_812773, partial [Gymnopus androsaceus JB14]
IIFYNHILTFSTEYRLIWHVEWKAPKVLFLLIRYIVPLCLLLQTHCAYDSFSFTLKVSTWTRCISLEITEFANSGVTDLVSY